MMDRTNDLDSEKIEQSEYQPTEKGKVKTPKNSSSTFLVKADEIDIEKRIAAIPSTRYYGSKRRLLQWVYDNLKGLDFYTVLDGFGGTGSVSLLFKAMCKSVYYHDALYFNTLSAKALLSNESPPSRKVLTRFIKTIDPTEGFISNTFSGLYYTDSENAWLDGFLKVIKNNMRSSKRNVLYYSLFQACLQKRPFNSFHRANLYLRENRRIKRRFGNQTTWDTTFENLIERAYLELSRTKWNSGIDQKVLSPGDVSAIKPGFDLVYLDPPYIDPNSWKDTYLKRYHFLEGLANPRRWENSIEWHQKTLCLEPKAHITAWERKSSFRERLFDLIKSHSKSIVVLSYVDGGYPSGNEIHGYFKSIFHKTRHSTIELSHALTKGKKKELLFIGIPE